MSVRRLPIVLFMAASLALAVQAPLAPGGSSEALARTSDCGKENGPLCEIGTSCEYWIKLAMWVCTPFYNYYPQ